MHNVSLPLVPSTPLGLENQILSDNYLSNPSQLNSSTGPYLVRLNEQHDSKAWRSTGSSKWLDVFLGKQNTLTHVALQSIGGGVDVSELKVQSEKNKDGTKWISYIKEIDGKEIPKVCLLPLLQGFKKHWLSFTAANKASYYLSRGHSPKASYRRSTAGHKAPRAIHLYLF